MLPLIRNIMLPITIIAAAYIELGCISFYKNNWGVWNSPLVMLGSGLFVGIAFLALIYNRQFDTSFKKKSFIFNDLEVHRSSFIFHRFLNKPIFSHRITYLFDFLLIALGIYYCEPLLTTYIKEFPITDFYNTKGSDVIPSLGILTTKFLNGEFPYTEVKPEEWAFGHGLLPGYLPLFWLPFIFAEFLNLDYRIFAFGFFLLCWGIFYGRILAKEPIFLLRWFNILLPFIAFYWFMESDNTQSLKWVVETLIIGYYLLLIVSFFEKRIWYLPVLLAVCMLSRYSIALFIPLILWVLALEKGWFVAAKMGGLVGLLIVGIYVLPFLAREPGLFFKKFNNYATATTAAWERSDSYEKESKQSIFNTGVGMSIYVARVVEAPAKRKLKLFQSLQLGFSFGAVLLLGLLYWQFRAHFDYRLFLLGSLKIYFVLFYNFIQYPFIYLFLVPIYVSVPLVFFVSSSRMVSKG